MRHTANSNSRGFLFLLAGVILIAGASQVGAADSDKYDWQGTWTLSYKKELSGPNFSWAFLRIKDAFDATLAFSVDANGKVKGIAWGSVFYRQEYEGCAIVSKGSCITRCKGRGDIEGDKSWSSHWPETGNPPFPDEYARYLSDTIPVSGQMNGTTVHLKLGPPEDLLPFEVASVCVGPAGTQHISAKLTWFCPDLTKPCSASGHFLEIDLPLAHEARQPIHTSEVGGGLDGMVHIRHTCRNIRDGESGFVYVRAETALLHKESAVNSPTVVGMPWGSRLVFTDTMQKNGTRWYHINLAGGFSGWVRSSDTTCNRPPPHPPGKRLRLQDTGLGNEHPAASMVAGANG